MSETSNVDRYGSGSGKNGSLYAIEARTVFHEPQMCNGFLLTKEWRRIPVRTVGRGVTVDLADAGGLPMVPTERWETPHARDAGLQDLPQATLLAQRFQMEANGRVALCVETRLVRVELEWSYSTREIGVTEPFSLFESTRFGADTKPRDETKDGDSQQPDEQGA